jgi:hypothetical protein
MITPNCANCRKLEKNCRYDDSKSILVLPRDMYACCDEWESTYNSLKKYNNSKEIEILNAALVCVKRQYDNVCTTGSSRCITCDFNCKQGTLSERKNALRVAIDTLEKEKLE